MSFDIEKMFCFCVKEIERFSHDHKDEIFYSFAIDANLLCLNSEEEFINTLSLYRDNWDRSRRIFESWDDLDSQDVAEVEHVLRIYEKYKGLNRSDKSECIRAINEARKESAKDGNPYLTEERVKDVRENTGDWKYQGFSEFTINEGFDYDEYQKHYDMDEVEQKRSAYGLAMDAVIDLLRNSSVFDCIRKSEDFKIVRVEHNY